ncbi:FlxA-like family protein [Cedecea colo]|uniref:FlxA protein n=1 Tax=Cedecea colo TaxID=2552946 RepID=A0ABX0VQS7_9ENTR|nr:FlxA-like family protein [Cedecea colo]NIY49096.1 hypothetical protein [Cedecea colo]
MTSINSTALQGGALATTVTGNTSSGSDNSTASQINLILQQITKLTGQLKDIASSGGSAEEKQKQQELIQAQITMLQAQIAQLQHKQAEDAQQKQEQNQIKAEGVNYPSESNQIDILI